MNLRTRDIKAMLRGLTQEEESSRSLLRFPGGQFLMGRRFDEIGGREEEIGKRGEERGRRGGNRKKRGEKEGGA